MRPFVAVTLAMTLTSCARSLAPSGLLAVPHGRVTCQRHAAAPAERPLVYWVLDGRRFVTTEYDSTGSPIQLTAGLQPSEVPGRQVYVQFSAGVARGWLGDHRAGRDVELRPMSDAETAQARELAAWLWRRGCPPRT